MLTCPQCKSNNLHTTLLGFLYWRKPGPDNNRATCQECGWVGTAHDAGAQLISPVKGSENMTDEEFKQWSSDWVKRGMPMVETLGAGYYNPNGLKRIKLKG